MSYFKRDILFTSGIHLRYRIMQAFTGKQNSLDQKSKGISNYESYDTLDLLYLVSSFKNIC